MYTGLEPLLNKTAAAKWRSMIPGLMQKAEQGLINPALSKGNKLIDDIYQNAKAYGNPMRNTQAAGALASNVKPLGFNQTTPTTLMDRLKAFKQRGPYSVANTVEFGEDLNRAKTWSNIRDSGFHESQRAGRPWWVSNADIHQERLDAWRAAQRAASDKAFNEWKASRTY